MMKAKPDREQEQYDDTKHQQTISLLFIEAEP
jgi:hypothetical protein